MLPLDPRQFTIWYRLRRMPRAVFVAGIGGILTTALIIGFFALTCRFFGVDYGRNLVIILTVFLAIAVMAAYDWTWRYMEQRYAATRGVLCRSCGYDLKGDVSGVCPECGTNDA